MSTTHRKMSILLEEPGCSYKTCRKSNPSRQHSSRRHTDIPYLRRVNGKVVKFTRSGKEGDEERPFKCCCGKEYQNTRSLADHLAAGCEVFNREIEQSSSLTRCTDVNPSSPQEHTVISKAELKDLKDRIERLEDLARIKVRPFESLQQHYKQGQYPHPMMSSQAEYYHRYPSVHHDIYPSSNSNNSYYGEGHRRDYGEVEGYYYQDENRLTLPPPPIQGHSVHGVSRMSYSGSNSHYEPHWAK